MIILSAIDIAIDIVGIDGKYSNFLLYDWYN